MNKACVVTVSDGVQTWGPYEQHDWRLLERKWFRRGVGEGKPFHDPPRPGKFSTTIGIDYDSYEEGNKEVWYCTVCRVIEEREVLV